MNKPSYQKNKAGFTLIEVLIASLIFVVVITVATSVFVVNSTVGDKTRTIRELSQSARYGLEAIAREARNSDTMSVVGTDLTITSKDETVKIYRYDSAAEEVTVNEEKNSLFPENVRVDNWSVVNIADTNNPYPLIQIEMQLSYNLGTGKKSESYKQTYRTALTNRSYPAINF